MKKLLNLEDLTQKESYKLFSEFSQYNTEKQSAILALLRVKLETTDEILGALQHFTQYSKIISHDFDVIDIVGTGGDEIGTFNISTAASIVVASCGVFVAKHGGRSVTSKSGSYDVTQALGIKILQNAEESLESLQKLHYTYLLASLFNDELKKYMDLRKKLGFPTIFNILGPLLNPMHPKRYVIGVYRRDLVQKVANVLKSRNIKHALVVHSDDGLDEISISSKTHIIEIKNEIISEYDINYEEFGIDQANISDIKGMDANENADIIKDILSGKVKGPKLNIVLINSAAGLYIAGKSQSIADGINLAKNTIKEGKASVLLNQIRGKI